VANLILHTVPHILPFYVLLYTTSKRHKTNTPPVRQEYIQPYPIYIWVIQYIFRLYVFNNYPLNLRIFIRELTTTETIAKSENNFSPPTLTPARIYSSKLFRLVGIYYIRLIGLPYRRQYLPSHIRRYSYIVYILGCYSPVVLQGLVQAIKDA
jgi:hypothetical protein